MTDTSIEDRLAALEQLMLGGVEVAPTAAPAAPAHVAAGELIESAWGNSVVDRLAWQEYLLKIGETVERNGKLMILGGTGVVTTDATGGFVVGFAPRVFVAGPPVAFCNVFSDLNWWCNVIGVNVTGFSAKVYNGTGGIVANNTLSIQWSAFGVVAT